MAPQRADVCIVGAGAAGCVLAARLSERADRTVCLVEAGPDYGHHDDGRWPADLLDASDCATSHDWGYGVDVACRVVGGCSAHNGCLVVWGTPADYDEWAAATGDDAWGWDGMAPLLARAEAAIGTRRFAPDEVGAFTRAALDGWAALGEPVLDDFNAVAATRGAGLIPVNRRGRSAVERGPRVPRSGPRAAEPLDRRPTPWPTASSSRADAPARWSCRHRPDRP